MNPLYRQWLTGAARLRNLPRGALPAGASVGRLIAAGSALRASLAAAGPSQNEPPIGEMSERSTWRRPGAPNAVDAASTQGHHVGPAGRRDYALYVPQALTAVADQSEACVVDRGDSPAAGATGRVPLVVMLHGCTQDPADFAAGTGMNELAQARGFIVLYPAQSREANPQGCWNWFKHSHQSRTRGEPSLIAGMVRDVMATHPVDPRRVYVAGLSAGGAMAAVLGDTHPDLFAAVGVHSGLAAGSARDLPSALGAMRAGAPGSPGRADAAGADRPPTIVFHGDADATVHPANGEHVAAASAGTGAEVEEHVIRTPGRRDAVRRVHRDARGEVRVEQWRVAGAPHAWSGGRAAGSYTDAAGPDASAEMLRFFMAHPKPA